MPRKRNHRNRFPAVDHNVDRKLRCDIQKKFNAGMAGFYMLYHVIHGNEVMLERMRDELGTHWYELQQQLLSKGLIDLVEGVPEPTSKGVRLVLMLSFDQSLN